MSFDHAYGAVLGAFVGDAAGAVLEFMPRPDVRAVSWSVVVIGRALMTSSVGAVPACRLIMQWLWQGGDVSELELDRSPMTVNWLCASHTR